MSAKQNPWYVETFLAIGGWIAGLLAAVAIFAMAFAIVGDFKDDGSDVVAALIALFVGGGFVFTGAAIGGPDKGDFTRHFSIAAIAAGLTAATGGVWYLALKVLEAAGAENEAGAGWAGLAAAFLLAVFGWFLVRRMRDGILTFLTTLAVYGVTFLSIVVLSNRYFLSSDYLAPDHFLPPLCALLGAVLFLEKRFDAFVRPVGAALMIAPMAHLALVENARFLFETRALATFVVLFSKTALLAAALYCLSFLRGRYALAPLIATAGLAAAAVWLLPNAGAVAMVILLAAVAANHRGLAVVGIVALAWFIGRFYYDLSMTLLEKSAVIAAMGAATLAGALLFHRLAHRGEAQAVSGGNRRGALAVLGAAAVFAAALGWVNYGVWRLETAFRDAREIYLPLGPRDPRSLIQGDYMVLNFDRGIYPPVDDIATLPDGGDVFLKLDENSVASFSRVPPPDDAPGPDEVRIGYVKTANARMRYVPESWFFQEGEAELFQPARFAVALVAPNGQARLVALANENRERLGKR